MSAPLKLYLLTNHAVVLHPKTQPPETANVSLLTAVVAAANEAVAVSRHPLASRAPADKDDDWPESSARIAVLHLGDYTGPSDPIEPAGPLTLATTLGTTVAGAALLRTDGPPELCPEVFGFARSEAE